MSDFLNSTVNTKIYNLMSDEHQIITITDKEAIVENIGTIVSGDTNSCLLTFEINRFQDGIDLSDKKIRFNYRNSNGKFYDIAVNVKYNDDVIRFSWLLPYSLTQPGGNVIASIEFYGSTEYDERYSYKTKNFKLSVEKSLGVDDGSDESYNNWTIKIENDVEAIQNKIVKIEKEVKSIHVPTKLSELENDSGYAKTTDIPDKLPNPQKLTFAGAVTAEYDGSSEVTVDILNGASEEQTAQIQTNTNDISELKNKTSELKSDLRTLLLTDINIIQDKYIDYNSGIAYNYAYALNATDYIEISEFDTSIFFYGLYYNEDNNAGLAFYDYSKTFIPNSGIKLYQLPNKITIPLQAKFIRVTVPQTNTTFALSFASDNAKVNAFIDETRNKVVTDDECTFIKKSKNLFDKNTVTLGYYVDPGTGNLLENANFWVSDFIKVEPNQAYTIRYKNQGAQYNANKQGIGNFTLGYSDNTSALSETGTTKSNAKYVRFCGSLAQLDSDQFEKGDVFTSYEEFSKKIESSLIPKTHKTLEDIIYKIFSGTNTKIKLVGDSITHGVGGTGYEQNGEYIASFFGNNYYRNPNGYCWAKLFKDYLESKFSCSVTNNAVSGTSFNELNNAFTTLVSDSDDIVICMYGTNNRDSLSSMPTWIQSFINKCNDLGVDLIIMTPIPASITEETRHENHIEDVCNTIKKLCIKNNVVFVDTNQIMLDYCEYRDISINTLLADGLHPNDNGYLVMFNVICKSLGITRKVTGATW